MQLKSQGYALASEPFLPQCRKYDNFDHWSDDSNYQEEGWFWLPCNSACLEQCKAESGNFYNGPLTYSSAHVNIQVWPLKTATVRCYFSLHAAVCQIFYPMTKAFHRPKMLINNSLSSVSRLKFTGTWSKVGIEDRSRKTRVPEKDFWFRVAVVASTSLQSKEHLFGHQ